MNEKFINIKVDREERPDLDNVFQKSLAILTGVPGGWPLSMFLDENGVPFSLVEHTFLQKICKADRHS